MKWDIARSYPLRNNSSAHRTDVCTSIRKRYNDPYRQIVYIKKMPVLAHSKWCRGRRSNLHDPFRSCRI